MLACKSTKAEPKLREVDQELLVQLLARVSLTGRPMGDGVEDLDPATPKPSMGLGIVTCSLGYVTCMMYITQLAVFNLFVHG